MEADQALRFDAYLEMQSNNLSESRHLPHFTMVESISALYDLTIRIASRAGETNSRELLIVCHRALLSAAATIGRALPSDSLGVTRRAVEAARLAVALKHDPKNFERWLSEEQRMARWNARTEGVKPDTLNTT